MILGENISSEYIQFTPDQSMDSRNDPLLQKISKKYQKIEAIDDADDKILEFEKNEEIKLANINKKKIKSDYKNDSQQKK